MDRSEFLRLIGISSGAAVLAGCLQGCAKQQDTPTLNVDFTLDLTQSANSALNTNGGYLVTHSVIVARTLAGNFIAVAAACTHEGQTVQYVANAHQFHCPRHGANFNDSGTVVNGPASSNLQQMTTTLTGTNLRVKS